MALVAVRLNLNVFTLELCRVCWFELERCTNNQVSCAMRFERAVSIVEPYVSRSQIIHFPCCMIDGPHVCDNVTQCAAYSGIICANIATYRPSHVARDPLSPLHALEPLARCSVNNILPAGSRVNMKNISLARDFFERWMNYKAVKSLI